jgi:hypothetical protein
LYFLEGSAFSMLRGLIDVYSGVDEGSGGASTVAMSLPA